MSWPQSKDYIRILAEATAKQMVQELPGFSPAQIGYVFGSIIGGMVRTTDSRVVREVLRGLVESDEAWAEFDEIRKATVNSPLDGK